MIDTFVIPGKPVGKGRPRFDRRGHAYTPETTRQYEAHVVRCCRNAGIQPRDGPVMVTVMIYWPIPSSWGKKRHDDAVRGLLWPTTKPDIDNVIKAVLDGMTMSGVCWHDDNQVVCVVSKKIYSDYPRVDVKVEDV